MACSKLCVSLLIVVLCTFVQLPSAIAGTVEEMGVQIDDTASFRGTNVNSGSEEEVEPQAEEKKPVVESEGSVDLEDSRRLVSEGDGEAEDETAEVAENSNFRGASVKELVKALGDALDEEEDSIKREEALDPITLSKLVAKIMKITTAATSASVAPMAKVAKLIAKAVPIL
eukprot:GHVS01048083.1.p1 GENE.GHVS01048083.1~~GHVS01048083.1.p1  ORF type:complete len:172 (+),score=37.55 GHVS01048083.1:145-660(+)